MRVFFRVDRPHANAWRFCISIRAVRRPYGRITDQMSLTSRCIHASLKVNLGNMKTLRFWMLSIFAALASLAFFVSSSSATPETVQKIADGVWFREGDLKNLGHCNNIVI